ncbi:hypothetical protein NL676_012710 [Syzygium grande]|nr:hypothetical protein NL676_012710 [Syzygium grande]
MSRTVDCTKGKSLPEEVKQLEESKPYQGEPNRSSPCEVVVLVQSQSQGGMEGTKLKRRRYREGKINRRRVQ